MLSAREPLESKQRSTRQMLARAVQDRLAAIADACDVFPRDLSTIIAEFSVEDCVEVLLDHWAKDVHEFAVCESEAWIVDSERTVISTLLGRTRAKLPWYTNLVPRSASTALAIRGTSSGKKQTVECEEITVTGLRHLWEVPFADAVNLTDDVPRHSPNCIHLTSHPDSGWCDDDSAGDSCGDSFTAGLCPDTGASMYYLAGSVLALDERSHVRIAGGRVEVRDHWRRDPEWSWQLPREARCFRHGARDDVHVLVHSRRIAFLSETFLSVILVDLHTGAAKRTIDLPGPCRSERMLTVDTATDTLYVYEKSPFRVWACV